MVVDPASGPTERARELVRGGVDYHMHIAPDFVSRGITDVQLARRCLETGQAGFGLKSHYSSTAERAQVVAEAVPGVTMLGAITLKRSVGGLTPLSVEIAAREGRGPCGSRPCRPVNEQHEVLAADPEGKVRLGSFRALPARGRPRVRAGARRRPTGRAVPEATEVLEVVRDTDEPLHGPPVARRDLRARRGAVGAGSR